MLTQVTNVVNHLSLSMKLNLALVLTLASLSAAAQKPFDPVPFVNPFIGTGGHGHTFPGATAPFGLVQLSPDTRTSMMDWDACSGYHFSDSIIYGFSHTHLSGTGVPDYCDLLLMPFTGRTVLDNKLYASPFSKKNEQAEAGYYKVLLDKHNIEAELTATPRTGIHKYVYPKDWTHRLLIDLRHRDEVLDSEVSVTGDNEISGYRISKAWAAEQHVYFVIQFSRDIKQSEIYLDEAMIKGTTARGKSVVCALDFGESKKPLVVRVGISGVSIEGARKNLEAEAKDFDFDQYKENVQALWRKQLSKMTVEGGSDDQKTTFYTALYHTMVAPNIWNDVDGQYRGRDNKIHKADGHDVYTVFSLWDTYRAANPLYTILEPKRTNDFIQTFLRQYEQGGLLPIWELSGNETDCMIGNHAIPVICDAWIKGIRGYDANLALEAMAKSAKQDRLGLKYYRELGYVPSDKEAESVSKTLEYAFDDWCIGRMAGQMGRQELSREFTRRAQYWKNLFDPSTGFFRAKNNACWYEPFDPREVNFNFTEANAWQYRFAVAQDVNTLMDWLGGPAGFAGELDKMFADTSRTTGRQQADITGLIGQYAHGNEPSHHVAYLYNFAGQPWKTQQRVRQIMDEYYGNRPDGLSGNEDCGQMSAWLVFSAMGFYPVTPGEAQYVIGTPWFEKITIKPDDKTPAFVITAPGVSANRCYIQGAKFNNDNWTRSWVPHQYLKAGGTLAFTMSDKPTTWATEPAMCPSTRIKDATFVPVPYVKTGSRAFRGAQEVALGCADTSAVIHFTLNGNEPSNMSLNYDKPIKIESNVRLRMVALHNNNQSLKAEAQFTRINSNLKVVRYANPYNPQYTARGDEALINGLRGGNDFRTGDWQGFEGVDLDVVLDLGAPTALNRISIGFLQDENAWIFYPVEVVYEISDDGVTFRPLGKATNPVAQDAKGTLVRDFSVEGGGLKARYLRVVGKSAGMCPAWHKGAGFKCWIFADEVVVE